MMLKTVSQGAGNCQSVEVDPQRAVFLNNRHCVGADSQYVILGPVKNEQRPLW
jgi:hypothetical protein